MRRTIITAALLALPAAALPGAAPHAHPHDTDAAPDSTALREAVMRLREALRQAAAARDIAALQAIYAEGFTHTHGSGRMDGREARILAVASGSHPTIELAPTEELAIRTFGSHTAIATGRSPIHVAAEGRSADFRWIAVYVRGPAGLQLAASQASRIAPPA